MNPRIILSILYGLHVVWTGLLANIQAQAYEANALWFCLVMGLIVLAGAFLWQSGRGKTARAIGGPATALVFGFYLYSLASDPAVDANHRVGLVILSSLAHLVVLFLPRRRGA